MADGATELWHPKAIGRVEIRNRFVLTGHGTAMVSNGQQMVDYYAERARGGVGLIMLGTQQVHPSSPGLGHLLLNYDDGIIPALRAIAAAVHRHGARIFGYIGHFGAQANTRPEPPWSASAFFDLATGQTTHAMTEAEMQVIAQAHADAALRNLDAGMDGIEVHGGHGLLLHQFLSPWTNHRTDDYGGSVENRLRFPEMVLSAVRARIGPGVPLGMRLSGDEALPGGLTVSDMQAIVPRLVAAADLDFVDVSAGNDRHAISNMLHHPPMGLPVAPYAEAARAIRAGLSVPVIHGTRIDSPAAAAALLRTGAADFAGMVRALIADPHLPNKLRDGRARDITPCVACEQACIGHLERGEPISCVGRPETGREADWSGLVPAAVALRVVVVGAGPAGMAAAAIAAERGHAVTLLERDSAVGGQLQLAALAPGRDEWLNLVAHQHHRVVAAGVDLRLSTTADAVAILALRPDVVVMATGAAAAKPEYSGADHLASHRAALDGTAKLGQRVLVLDRTGHQQGVSTALHLASRGHAVTIATAAARVGHRLERPNFTRANMLLAQAGVTQVVDCVARAISPPDAGHTGVSGHHAYSGAAMRLDGFDSIVDAAPATPRTSLAEALTGATRGALRIECIGDCRAARDVEAAILDAHRLARAL